MYDNGVPLITLEIQGMKHIVKDLDQQLAELRN